MFSQKEDTIKKVEVITFEILDQLRAHCSCGFAENLMITSGVFTCFKTGSVHFRAYAHGTANVTAAAIIQHIQGWVYEGAVLTVDLLQLRVDKMCTVAISSITYNNDGCESSTDTVSPDEPTAKTSTLGLMEILVTLILLVSILLLIIVIVVVAILALKKYCHKRNEHDSVNAM